MIIHEVLGQLNDTNGTTQFKNLNNYLNTKHLLLLKDIWWSKFYSIFKVVHFFNTSVN
jgi:hypothetical protein